MQAWNLILEGSVRQKQDFASISLGKNAIVGILESDWFVCDYIAEEDSVLEVIPYENAEQLKQFLIQKPEYREIFLHAVMEQRHQMLSLYFKLQVRISKFYSFVLSVYSNYQKLCSDYKLDPLSFSCMESFAALELQHKTEQWEVNQSISLVKKHINAYLSLMGQDDSLTVGAIMEAAAQMRRCMLGIGEMVQYANDNWGIMLAENGNDLFHLLFDLGIRAGRRGLDVEPVKKEIFYLTGYIKKLKSVPEDLLKKRTAQYEAYDFGSMSGEFTSRQELDITKEDCLEYILDYAELPRESKESIKEAIQAFGALGDRTSADADAYKLRKQVTPLFFRLYEKVFFNAVKNERSITPIIEMFLNFGFVDVSLTGEEQSKALYDLTARLNRFSSEHVYTIYQWLKSIYEGKKEPSKNDFDQDYKGWLLEQKKNGDLTQEQVQQLQDNLEEKARFELQNMFASADKVTYGKITTFCPILNDYDLINSLDKMAVTVERLEGELNKLRKVDYQLFYREVDFAGPGKDILNHEQMNQEILPDIILMPNAGTKAMMWQETAGKTRDTSARFVFPIFTMADLEEMMVETAARYRWEMCRKIQGVRWNDIHERSLTSEYCDYLQFYRKNHDLSKDAKDKLKNALTRARNNYREVFVKDYQGWIKYESKGSFRLNKTAREILFRYCPFAKDVRNELKSNPTYQNMIPKLEADQAKKLQRINALYMKYAKAGGEMTQQMNENALFYQL